MSGRDRVEEEGGERWDPGGWVVARRRLVLWMCEVIIVNLALLLVCFA